MINFAQGSARFKRINEVCSFTRNWAYEGLFGRSRPLLKSGHCRSCDVRSACLLMAFPACLEVLLSTCLAQQLRSKGSVLLSEAGSGASIQHTPINCRPQDYAPSSG